MDLVKQRSVLPGRLGLVGGDGVGQGCERGREHGAFEVLVAAFGLVVRRGRRCRRSG